MQIAVDQDEGCAAGGIQAGVDGCALAGVVLKAQNANLRAALNPFRCPIARTVIDEDNFMLDARERAAQLRLQNGNIIFLIENRNDHRDSR